MERKALYQGLFIEDKDSITKLKAIFPKLENGFMPGMHITFNFKPAKEEIFPEELVGKEFKINIIGKAMNDYNGGVLCTINDKEIMQYYKGAEQMYITTYIGVTGKAKDTAYLKFESIEPVQIKGIVKIRYNKL